MSNNKNPRYERKTEPAPDLNKTGEIVTGVPITEDVPAGSPQFAAFEAHAEKVNEANLRINTDQPIEYRDNRGNQVVDGKYAEQIPIHEVDAMAEEMAGRFANGVERTSTQLDGNTLTVTIVTKHGVAKGSADVKSWNKAGVKAALGEIEDKLTGKAAAESDNPDKTLADAVRAAAKA